MSEPNNIESDVDYSKRRCGDCANCGFSKVNVKRIWKHSWRDFPYVYLTEDHFVWQCKYCHEEYVDMAAKNNIDDLIERSLRCSASEFIKTIKDKIGLNHEQVALGIGVHPDYLATIEKLTKTPTFQFWDLLRTAISRPNLCKHREKMRYPKIVTSVRCVADFVADVEFNHEEKRTVYFREMPLAGEFKRIITDQVFFKTIFVKDGYLMWDGDLAIDSDFVFEHGKPQ